MSHSAIDFTPLLYVSRSPERSFLLLISGLLLPVSTNAVIPTIHCVDLLIFLLLLLWGPLVTRFKELSSGLWGLNADVRDCEQINRRFRIFHGDLLHSLNNTDPITESIDDFNVLDVWDSIPGVIETFHIVPEAFIMLLLDVLQGFCCRRMLVRALKFTDEHGT
jgi:hypothetical protein